MTTSVLINNYNNGPYLRDCLESVMAQTLPADEIIVYDDGSTDGSVEMLRRYQDRVILIEGRHESASFPWDNQGRAIYQAFLRSTGELIFLLDGDDQFSPEKIARFAAAFKTLPQPVLIQAPMHWIDPAGSPLPRWPEMYKHVPDPLAAVYARNDPDLFYPTSALACSRAFLERILPFDWADGIRLFSDTRLGCAALVTGRIVTLDEELGAWRRYLTSDSAKRTRGRTYLLRQTWRRTRMFNHFCRATGRPAISIWRNRRFYGHLLRVFSPSLYASLAVRKAAAIRPVADHAPV
jgi:glycosyltransferase involved in cell wall biosynthesis